MTENNELEKQGEKEIISSLVINGDLSKLSPSQQVQYYHMFCESLGLNPLTKPFDIVNLQGRKILYANKNCGEQLRKMHGVSVIDLKQEIINDLCVTTVKGQDKTGRVDMETSAVNIKGLYGDALANAMMKSSTKAKRRLTLSLCSVGLLDETELETIPGAQKGEINITGVSSEIKEEFRAKEPIKQLSQETLGAIYDLMNAMEWGKTRKDAKLKLLETIGNEKALELMQTEYAKYKAEQSAKGGDDILL